ncbi:hypothetical protein [Croceibacterium aestuarii]|uniref:hypothetical protein n=1 Tax=Croceibacterium aestuarii TaxID=3064139 RepID=UPI00272EB394|nr:hypothetical protein [Croceibacterium sp. D39]
MKVSKLAAVVVATATMATASPAAAQFFGGTCTRAELQEMADKYVKAQTEGLPLYIPMGNWVTYHENGELSTMSQGTLSTAMPVNFHRALLDTDQCKVFLELVSYEGEKPYVIAVQFGARGGNAGNFEVISTTTGDWLFDAKYTYEYARREEWSEIPEDKRNTPAELKAAADAYLDLFKDKSVQVPWGTPCNRLEGSVYTTAETCNVGVPDNIDMTDREYVIDPVIGAVDVFLKMGPNKRPDSHLFRIENGKIRYVHTVTNCLGDDNCGFDSFAEMLKKNPKMHPDFKD